MELWDAYNEAGQPLGVDLVRGETIPEGMYHLVAEILVMHKDGSILLMKRDPHKDIHPGAWECSAGGSVLKGETMLQGAIRELREETGIKENDLRSIYHDKNGNCLFEGFFCKVDWPKEMITLQEGETSNFQWVDYDTFYKMYHRNEFTQGRSRRLADFVKEGTLESLRYEDLSRS